MTYIIESRSYPPYFEVLFIHVNINANDLSNIRICVSERKKRNKTKITFNKKKKFESNKHNNALIFISFKYMNRSEYLSYMVILSKLQNLNIIKKMTGSECP